MRDDIRLNSTQWIHTTSHLIPFSEEKNSTVQKHCMPFVIGSNLNLNSNEQLKLSRIF